jgi:hypothetical protein
MNLEKQNKILNEFLKKIVLPELNPEAVILIGSFFTNLSYGSDIDLVIFLKDKRISNFRNELKKLKEIINKLHLKQETDMVFIHDRENPRIELKLTYKSQVFDLVITNSKIYCGNHPQDVSTDNFELYIGNLFANCKLMFQNKNYYDKLKKQYLPYYDNKLRVLRINLLKKDIRRITHQLEINADEGRLVNAVYYLNRLLCCIIQLRFMQKKVYPISYKKWIDYQFNELLKDPASLHKLNQILKGTDFSSKGFKKLAKSLYKMVFV